MTNCSEWRAEGHTIVDKWVKSDGARFKAYRRLAAKQVSSR